MRNHRLGTGVTPQPQHTIFQETGKFRNHRYVRPNLPRDPPPARAESKGVALPGSHLPSTRTIACQPKCIFTRKYLSRALAENRLLPCTSTGPVDLAIDEDESSFITANVSYSPIDNDLSNMMKLESIGICDNPSDKHENNLIVKHFFMIQCKYVPQDFCSVPVDV
ncbi:hypothetical protein GCK32_006418 [Trichostrongylus colubriformis]|uniref:Uncharacterized protein n=1 Tax=Trichostrongylus colubriformis TaxID=6319 RepID=A0AAN8EWI2_TRICO